MKGIKTMAGLCVAVISSVTIVSGTGIANNPVFAEDNKYDSGISVAYNTADTKENLKNGFVKNGSSWIYYIKGKVSAVPTDIVNGTINGINGWWFIRNGKADLGYTGVTNNVNGWWYVKNGKVDFNYNGFANNENGWWYIENGKVTFKRNDVIYGRVKGENAWWNVKGSKVIFNETIEQNRNGWCYIRNGKVDFGYTGVKNNINGWWYVKNGKVDFNYNGFANNENGWWYIENGKVTFKKNDVIYGRVKGENAWWNVKGSKVIFNETIEQNRNGWWYIRNGKVDFTRTGVEHNQNGWWYVKNGKVQFDYTGIRNNRNGWWYIKNGKVDFSYTGIASNENGTWYIVNGKVDFNANGIRTAGNTTYTVSNGKITGTLTDNVIRWNGSWQYASYSKIHSGTARLYKTTASGRKNIIVAVNAGHGTKGGSSVRTLCHPDGTAKVTGGSTQAGSVTATAINEGTTLLDGTPEATVTLELAKKVKEKLLSKGYDVLMLRESADVQLDNIARAVIANHYADCHISLHYDSTTSDKGFYYISVPNVASYRRMEPVASNWKRHEALGQALLKGVRNNGLKVYGNGYLPTDLTQTSYSTIPSVSVEVGDRASSHSNAALEAMAKAISDGVGNMF